MWGIRFSSQTATFFGSMLNANAIILRPDRESNLPRTARSFADVSPFRDLAHRSRQNRVYQVLLFVSSADESIPPI